MDFEVKAGSPGVKGVNWRPDYEPGDSVDPRSVVKHENRLWFAKRATAETPSEDATDWDIFVDYAPASDSQEAAEAARTAAEFAAQTAVSNASTVAADKATVAADRVTVTTARTAVQNDRVTVVAAAATTQENAALVAGAAAATAADRIAVSNDRTTVNASRIAAAASATTSTTEANRAALAADSAVISGTLYETQAAGETATAVDGYFRVVSPSSGDAIDIRKRTSGGSTFIKSLPASARVDALEVAVEDAGLGAKETPNLRFVYTIDDPNYESAFNIDEKGNLGGKTFDQIKASVAAVEDQISQIDQIVGSEERDDIIYAYTIDDPYFQSAFNIDVNGNVGGKTINAMKAAIADLQENGGGGGGSEILPDVNPIVAAYGQYPDEIYLYDKGVVVNAAYDHAWTLPKANGEFVLLEPEGVSDAASGEQVIVAQLKVFDRESAQQTSLSFPCRFLPKRSFMSDPEVPQNIIFGPGDSTTAAYGGGFGGSWANEVMRLLTGFGRELRVPKRDSLGQALLVGGGTTSSDTDQRKSYIYETSIPAGTFTNFYARGTLDTFFYDESNGQPSRVGFDPNYETPETGSWPVKHEGRNGYQTEDYIGRAGTGNPSDTRPGAYKPNGFWNPNAFGTGQGGFDLGYYLFKNSFYADGALNQNTTALANGVLSDHSNLTLVSLIGVNELYSDNTIEESIADMGVMLDRINVTAPGARILLLGLPPCPELIAKNTSLGEDFGGDTVGSRTVSQRAYFQDALVSVARGYRDLVATRPWADFLPIAHQIDPETAFPVSTVSRSPVTTWKMVTSAYDMVHMRHAGYKQLAILVARYFMWRDCR